MTGRVPATATQPIIGGRFVTLDGMRGFAAIAVACTHFDRDLLPQGYMAVDFFFILSGFVLREAYEPRLAAGLGTLDFMRARILRLYPLFLIGLLLGFLRLGQVLLRHPLPNLDGMQFLGSFAANLLFLPSPFTSDLYPLNVPSWSLLDELLVNCLMIVLILRVRTGALLGLAVLCGVGLVWLGARLAGSTDDVEMQAFPLSAGWTWGLAHLGLLRALGGFCFGLAISALMRKVARRRTWLALVPIVILGLILFAQPAAQYQFAFNAAVVLVAFPLLVAWASRLELPLLVANFARLAGDLSFALYMVHASFAGLFASLGRVMDWPIALSLVLYLAVSLGVSYGLIRWVDPRMRQVLAKVTARS